MPVAKLKSDRVVAAICVFVLFGILTAGLWPFHAPRNQAVWLRNGLVLGRYGTALSAEALGTSGTENTGRSIEIWLQPTQLWYTSTILAFYRPGEPQQFSLYQIEGGLALQTELKSAIKAYDPARVAHLPLVFLKRCPRFIAITSGPQGTTAYADGTLGKLFRNFRPGNRAFTGRLVLGNSPVENDSWSGVWLGLAIYNRELTAAQVRRHQESWTAKGKPDIRDEDRSAAVYLFDEGSGNRVHDIVHSQAGSGADLLIPERYLVLDEKVLEPAWKEFRWRWSFWKSALMNIVGFIPFGFFFLAYLSSQRMRTPALATILLGAAVSLTIELLQAFLPTRDSGTTDLITNTLGTCLGVVLCRWKPTFLTQTLGFLPFLERLA